MHLQNKNLKNVMPSWKFVIDQLVTKNCLLFGNNSKFTSKKVTKYLLGTRDTIEVFKLYELRYLLIKIYPLIHNLFYNPRVNPKLKFQDIWIENNKPSQGSVPLPTKYTWPFKRRFSFIAQKKSTPPQILFASVTPNFSDIICSAAKICNMPWHRNRWLSGSITAAISYPSDKLVWQYLQDLTQKEVFQMVSQQWGSNKENKEKIKEKIKHYGRSRWPSLLVIPDVSNNIMILKEAKKVGLPVIGLVNSNCLVEIDYPIFAQDQTPQSIHFFCHFLAILIAKESVFIQHKRYTLQKVLRKTDTAKEIIEKKQNEFTLLDGVTFQKFKEPWKKPFFFKVVKPWQKKNARRYFLTLSLEKYHPLESKKYHYRKQRSKKKLPYKTVNFLVKQFKRNKTKKIKAYVKKLNLRKGYNSLYFKINSFRAIEFFILSKTLLLSSANAKNVFKQVKIKSKTLKKIDSFTSVNKNIFQKEYEKKLFYKNRYSKGEQKQVYQKLRNFIWFSKIVNLLTLHRRFSPKLARFSSTPPYFRRSFQHWSQGLKWRNHRTLIKNLLLLKLRKKKNWKYNTGFYKKKSKHPLKNKTDINTWETWVKQNIQKTF